MKANFKTLFFFLCVALFFSCSDIEEQSCQLQSEELQPFLISSDSAITISNQAIQAIAEQKATRSSSPREVNSVNLISLTPCLNTRATNGKSINTSLSLINYKDNKGFSVVASDKRLRPLYAVSDTRNIAINDTIKNKGLALFFHGVENDMQDAALDTLEFNGDGAVVPVTIPQVHPVIWRGPRLWGQGKPYNTYCFTSDGQQALVGCVAVACGIIMSHYEWSRSINEKKYRVACYEKIYV